MNIFKPIYRTDSNYRSKMIKRANIKLSVSLLLQIFIAILLMMIMWGCNTERYVARQLLQHPEWAETDTIVDTFRIEVPAIRIDTFVEIWRDTSSVDDIFSRFEDKLDSLTALELKNEVKYYITNKTVLPDTLQFYKDGVSVKVWQEGNMFRFNIDKDAETYSKIVPTIIKNYNVTTKPKKESWWSRLKDGFIIILLLVVIVLMGLSRIRR